MNPASPASSATQPTSTGGTPTTASSFTSGIPSNCGQPSASTTESSFLYVALNEGGNVYGNPSPSSPPSLTAFAVGDNGSLQRVPGFSCPGEVDDFDVDPSTHTLYVAGGPQVGSYSVAGDGAISEMSTVEAPALNSSVGSFYSITLDPLRQNGYAGIYFGAGHFLAEHLRVNAYGTLTDAGSLGDSAIPEKYYFTPDGSLAYGPYCYKEAFFVAYHPGPDGALNPFDPQATMPPLAPNSLVGCASTATISRDGKYLTSYFTGSFSTLGQAWLGGFAINSDGTLTQLPGFPRTQSQLGGDVVWDPTGQYLVTAEQDGVHVYSFSASSTPVQLAGPLGNGEMSHVMFNQSGTLLFATGISTQSVYVFQWNNGSPVPASGSPYIVAGQPSVMAIVQ